MPETEDYLKKIEKLSKASKEYAKTVKEPEEQKKNEKRVEEFNELIDNERELLKIFSKDRLKLEVVYNKKIFKFTIKPLTDTSDVEAIGLDFQTYVDLNDFEKEIILKKSRGETLDIKEQAIYDEKEKDLASGVMGNALEQTHHILATFLTPPSYNDISDSEKRHELRMEFWHDFPFDLKMFLFAEVMERLGINPETELKLFQVD